MAQNTQNHILKVLIAKDIARTVSAGSIVSPATLAEGEVVVTDVSNTVLNTTTVLGLSTVKVVQGRGATNPLREEIFHLGDITSYRGQAYEARVDQVSYVGFNGTSGSIDVINDNLYQMVFRDLTDELLSGQQGFEQMPYYRSSASATQESIAIGLMKNILATFSKIFTVERYVRFEMVNADAGSAEADTATVELGSKVVTMTGTTSLVAGDYIRFGTAVTDPVYRVASETGTGTNLVLSWPYQGTSASGLTVETIAAATAQAAAFGIKVTGLARYFDRLRWQYAVEKFNIGLSDVDGWGSTEVTNSVAPFPGTGVWQQVSMMEFSSWGNEGQAILIQEPPLTRENDTVTNETYALLGVGFKNGVPSDFGDPGIHKGQVILACAANTTGPDTFLTNIAGAATSVVDVMDAFVTQNGNFSAQLGNL